MIVLASGSPRRKKLLSLLIPEEKFIVLKAKIEESQILKEGTCPIFVCLRLAEEKAQDVLKTYESKISAFSAIIGADTIIAFEDRIIGQPRDEDDARRMLKMLSGRSHEVITGVAIITLPDKKVKRFSVKTKVEMKELSDDIIDWYISTGEPMDKAGAYAIQGLGARLVDRIKGSFTNVVGLPLPELREALKDVIN
jgi:septum formation protein